eukprot:COSAG02_NODE_42458_length_384_cov_0.978947_1_plen_34_part_10
MEAYGVTNGRPVSKIAETVVLYTIENTCSVQTSV